MWSVSIQHGSSCQAFTSCPTDDTPDDEPRLSCADTLYTFSENLLAVDAPAPINADADSLRSLVRLLNEALNRDAFFVGDPPSRSETDFLHKQPGQSSGRIAAPIRGPSV